MSWHHLGMTCGGFGGGLLVVHYGWAAPTVRNAVIYFAAALVLFVIAAVAGEE